MAHHHHSTSLYPESAHPIVVHSVETGVQSRWISPKRIHFSKPRGNRVAWDVIDSSDAAVVLIHDVSLHRVVCVRQLRPPLLEPHVREGDSDTTLPASVVKDAITLELCAGLCDKDSSDPRRTACREVLEETGYRVRPEDLECLGVLQGAVGIAAQHLHMYYVEVRAAQRVEAGGGVEDEHEDIEVVLWTYDDVRAFLDDKDTLHSTPVTKYMLLWFATHKMERARSAASARDVGHSLLGLGAGLLAGFVLGAWFARR